MAIALHVVGDRWTLLILRELLGNGAIAMALQSVLVRAGDALPVEVALGPRPTATGVRALAALGAMAANA